MTQKAGDDLFFLVFTSSLAGVFVKLKPPLKISKIRHWAVHILLKRRKLMHPLSK